MRTTTVFTLAASVVLLAAGCDNNVNTDPYLTGDLATTAPPDMRMPVPLLAGGEYLLGLELAPFNGLRLREQLVVTVSGERGAGGAFQHVELFAVGVADPKWKSDKPVGTVDNAAIDKDGNFTLDFGMVTLPGMASPTGTDVQFTLTLTGKISDDNTFCGAVEGMVPAFMAPLTGSKFKAVQWGKEPMPYETSCTGAMVKTWEHIKTCPTIAAGSNKMTSAEVERGFEVRLPSGGAPQSPAPLVFLFHGVGGTPKGMLDESQFEALLAKDTFVLVAPESATINGMKATLDWEFQLEHFDLDNRDLVFFDDLVTCLSSTYKVDAKRIYVTGMSGGGLMSTFLAANRSKMVAAAAPMSGGYLFQWPSNMSKTPVMVTWGGPTDTAFQQNFDTLARNLITAVEKSGHPLITCTHSLGHKWPPAMTAAAWAWLSAYTLGGSEKPFMNPLAAPFPAYCKFVQ